MKRPILWLILGLIAGFCLGYFSRPVKQTQKTVSEAGKDQQVTPLKTEIIKYKQTYIPAENKTGKCWTGSLASGSSKAWRCITGERIYDPCFETETGSVVCDIDPENPQSGFEMSLSESLPINLANKDTEDIPWLIILKNGMKCTPSTGAAGSIDGESTYIFCTNNAILIGETDPFPVNDDGAWIANVAYLDTSLKKIVKRESATVLKVWE